MLSTCSALNKLKSPTDYYSPERQPDAAKEKARRRISVYSNGALNIYRVRQLRQEAKSDHYVAPEAARRIVSTEVQASHQSNDANVPNYESQTVVTEPTPAAENPAKPVSISAHEAEARRLINEAYGINDDQSDRQMETV